MKDAGVTGHHVYIDRVHAERVGRDLREGGEVPLALGAHAGREPDLPARLDGHAGAFVRPYSRPLYIGDNANPLELLGCRL